MKTSENNLRSILYNALRLCCLALLIYGAFYVLHWFRSGWMHSDGDADGRPLLQDLNPDGDHLGFFKDHDADNNGVPNEQQAVSYARRMRNVPYDFLMGKFHDVLGQAGFVVCIDVPVRAYLRAGVSFPALLKQATNNHPEWFNINEENSPSSKYFYRRVRNYYNLFENSHGLEKSQKPLPGDWAFYGKWHIGLVSAVQGDNRYKIIEADPKDLRVVEINNEDMSKRWGRPTFFGRIKYN